MNVAKVEKHKLKLGMKMILFLQIIEEMYLNKPSICLNQSFIEALVILMHLMEKLKVMDLALPDVVSYNLINAQKPEEIQENKPAIVETKKKIVQEKKL